MFPWMLIHFLLTLLAKVSSVFPLFICYHVAEAWFPALGWGRNAFFSTLYICAFLYLCLLVSHAITKSNAVLVWTCISGKCFSAFPVLLLLCVNVEIWFVHGRKYKILYFSKVQTFIAHCNVPKINEKGKRRKIGPLHKQTTAKTKMEKNRPDDHDI